MSDFDYSILNWEILGIAGLFLILSLFFEKHRLVSLLLLVVAAFFLRLFFVEMDPFLHSWDERFHALVAKNMMDYPFRPTLWPNPVLEYDYKSWCCNYIWLHKQPFFLWQMAMSMKLFGVSIFALRLPSMLMGAFLLIPVYRVGKIIFNERTGYYAAFLMVFPFYQMCLISGAVGMDHNDMAFLFYLFLSIWSYIEFEHSGKSYWLILIGFFSGFAILTKWLTGLLVYAGWGMNLLCFREKRNSFLAWKQILLSFAITVVVVLPWQIYIFQAFPQEAQFELAEFSKHLTAEVEHHGGDWSYHFQRFGLHYAPWAWVVAPIILGLLFVQFKQVKNRKYLLAFLVYIGVVYLFFSFVVVSKLPSFTYIISPFVIIGFAMLIDFFVKIMNMVWKSKAWEWIFLLGAGIYFLQPYSVEVFFLKGAPLDVIAPDNRAIKMHNTEIYKKLNDLVPEDYIVFNVEPMEEVEAMFFSDRLCYFWIRDDQYNRLKAENFKMATFIDHGERKVPFYLLKDTSTLIIHEKLMPY